MYRLSTGEVRMKKWLEFFQKVFEEWNNDKVTRLAASLSYFTVFSLAPLLVVVIAVAGLIFGQDIVQQQIVAQVASLIGPDGAKLIDGLLNSVRSFDSGIIATALGIGAIILGATGVVGELKDALNTIWNVTPRPGNGLFGTFLERFLSLGMVLGIGFMLLVSLAISAGLAALGAFLRGYFEPWVIVAQLLDFVISFVIVALLFAVLFKFLPDVRVAWRDVWVGAFVTAALFTLGKYALGLYLGNSNLATPFGAAGSLVILFVWIYYAAQILFLGAEITQVYANLYGSGIKPKSDAVPLSDAARVAQGTLAPTGAAQPVGALAQTPPKTVPQPLYLQLPQRNYEPHGQFKPLALVGGALGVPLFGILRKAILSVEKIFPASLQHQEKTK